MFPINELIVGGSEQQLLELVKGIDKSLFKPLVVTLYPGAPLEQEIRQIPGAELISLNRKGKYDFWILARMFSLLREKKVDVIQPFLTPATFFGLVPALINHTPVKIVTERSGAAWDNRLGYDVYQKSEDFFTRFADWVVPNSEAGRGYLIARGINSARIKVIYNGINFERLTTDWTKVTKIREQMRLSPNGVVVGITATLTAAKDHVTFLQGAKLINQAMPQTKFAILGDGPLKPHLEDIVKDLGIEPFVTFFGNQVDVASYISSFDVFCLCSTYAEGCSNATLEAMALGKPVVVTDMGGNREVVEHGKTGLLVPPRSPEALANGVLTCLRQSKWAQDMGKRARETVLARFSLTRMVNDYEQLYTQAMQLKRR
jgi:glycosyltransferase involved in cell wall biosynthesis